MPRYFFNIVVRGRGPIPDPDGDKLAGDKEAREHAAMVVRDMLDNHIWYKRGLEYWRFVITNEAGSQIAVVPFARKKGARKLKKSRSPRRRRV
jgi:hypothetical protein